LSHPLTPALREESIVVGCRRGQARLLSVDLPATDRFGDDAAASCTQVPLRCSTRLHDTEHTQAVSYLCSIESVGDEELPIARRAGADRRPLQHLVVRRRAGTGYLVLRACSG